MSFLHENKNGSKSYLSNTDDTNSHTNPFSEGEKGENQFHITNCDSSYFVLVVQPLGTLEALMY